MSPKMSKPPKPKAIAFSLIPPMDNGHEPEAYRVMRKAREKWHPDLEGAKIALAWRKRLKADKDGHLLLGKCMKATDLQRELVNWDFVILLNKEAFQDPSFTPAKRLALIDHELCHATRALDKWYAPANDEYGRSVWRTRKHDIEEFRCIVERHGCYKKDLEAFADSLLKNRGNLVFPGMGSPVTDTPPKAVAPPEASVEERIRTRKAKIAKTGLKVNVKLVEPTDPPPGVRP
jgi:Putative phage metallopeptidase